MKQFSEGIADLLTSPCAKCPQTWEAPEDEGGFYCPGERETCVRYMEWRAQHSDLFTETSAEEEGGADEFR